MTKKICDKESLKLKQNTILMQDSGFQGNHPRYVKIRQPKKDSKKRKLSQKEKQENKKLAKMRIRVEHAICGIKRLRIVKDIYRNRKPKYV